VVGADRPDRRLHPDHHVYLPEFWLHPFGPMLKNLPLLAVLGLLLAFEKR
jgi:hypothetical protein